MRRRSLAAFTILVAASSAAPAPARASAWTLGRGRLTLKQSVSMWTASSKFASEIDTQLDFIDRGRVSRGDRIPFDPQTGGALRVFSLTSQAWLGVLDWLDVGFTLPVLITDFDTAPVDTVDGSVGLGDIQLEFKAGLPVGRMAFAISANFKFPTGNFDPSVFNAPLTEGQLDLALAAEAGISLHPFGYANARLGYRLRFENSENRRRPGDELFFAVEAGVRLPYRLMAKLTFDGLLGRHGEDTSVPGHSLELPLRRLFSLWGGLLFQATQALLVEVDVRILLAGEDFPAGVQVFLSGSYRFRLWGG